jgi:hypothetical protein
MEPDSSSNPDNSTTDGARLLAALQDLDDHGRSEDGPPMVWQDVDCLLLLAEMLAVPVQMVTVEQDAWNIHLADEVLVLDPSGAGGHKLVSLDVWGLSMELRSMLGQDGSIWG